MELKNLIKKYATLEGIHETAIAGLHIVKNSNSSVKLSGLCVPSLCVIVQGKKQILLNQELYCYSPSDYLAVSVDLPVTGYVIEASHEHPYLSLQIDLDPQQMAEFLTQPETNKNVSEKIRRGLFIGRMDEALLDSITRLVRLLDTPKDIAMLATSMLREIHYYLLKGEYGAQIVQLLVFQSHMQRISAVIQKIKADIRKTFAVNVLADMVNMSASSFHHHFKQITGMSPLQYQKRLRLIEARRILLTEEVNVIKVAYQVGYESSTQFHREYTRFFGTSPKRDIKFIKAQ